MSQFDLRISYHECLIPYIHKCFLPPPDMTTIYVKPGRFMKLRKWFLSIRTVSGNTPSASVYLKSAASVRNEYIRHLEKYYDIIHPLSQLRWYLALFESVLLWLYLLITPHVMAGFFEKALWREIKFTLDILCLLYIYVVFHTGLLNERWNIITLDPGKIAKKYLRTYFFVDLLSSIPADYITFKVTTNYHTRLYALFPSCIKLLRLPTIVSNFKTLRKWRSETYTSLYLLLVYYTIFIIWCTNLIAMAVINSPNREWSWYNFTIESTDYSTVMLHCLHRAIYTLMLVGKGMERSDIMTDVVSEMCFLTLGYILVFCLHAIFIRMLVKVDWADTNFEILIGQVKDYMHFKKLPENLRKKVISYYNYHYQKKLYYENGMMSTFSDRLQREIILAVRLPNIEKVPYFLELPQSLRNQLAIASRRTVYSNSDVVTRAGIPARFMFFIEKGTVAVFSATGKELCHLEDGQYFGEIGLVAEVPRKTSVVAIEHCEIYMLHRDAFQEIFSQYPVLLQRMRTVIQSL